VLKGWVQEVYAALRPKSGLPDFNDKCIEIARFRIRLDRNRWCKVSGGGLLPHADLVPVRHKFGADVMQYGALATLYPAPAQVFPYNR
jgi:hypothetical protein